MKRINRRTFLAGSVTAGASLAMSGCNTQPAPYSSVRGANEDIRLAVVGMGSTIKIGGRGKQHIREFRELEGVRVVALCDPDSDILNEQVKKFHERSEKVDAYADIRKLLEDKNIDAISVVTPNHWHALATIWGCQAGKDVYVEKPVSYNIREGRKMVEAARKYKRIVQTGLGSRASKALAEAFQYIRQGNLGKILVARGFCHKRRQSIGKVNGPQPIPKSIDYNLWCGPAPTEPLMRKYLHYDWHWIWTTGNGDIGNQGVHQMDICRWALGESKMAPRVMSIGGRFGYIDDGQTPNTQIIILDYKPAPLIFEVRGLPESKADSKLPTYRGIRVGVVIQCEGGYIAVGASKVPAYDNNDKVIKQFEGSGNNYANFIEVLRSRKVSDQYTDILDGHISTALCHMGNISHRIGAERKPGQIKEAIRGDKNSLEVFERFEEHLAANEIDLGKTPAILGPMLKMDTRRERFVEGHGLDRANELLSRKYRKGFVVPEKV